ncbi:hypothetical protein DID76_02960 [Candidatus Marinamargulisbacteria bacterium SCGC AG-414-C22]|nr:hypothetical protein DID76_02960 [Candidatus Marinamargulisbacteria bacterium SCGC AG-414-C22]
MLEVQNELLNKHLPFLHIIFNLTAISYNNTISGGHIPSEVRIDQDKDHIYIELEATKMNPDDISIDFENQALTITDTKLHINKKIHINHHIIAENIKANYLNGKLYLVIPKQGPSHNQKINLNF